MRLHVLSHAANMQCVCIMRQHANKIHVHASMLEWTQTCRISSLTCTHMLFSWISFTVCKSWYTMQRPLSLRHVRVCVGVWRCACIWKFLCMRVCLRASVYLYVYIHRYVCMYFFMYVWGPLVDQLLPTFHSTDNLTQRPHQYSSMPSMAYAVSHGTLLYDNVMAQHLMVRTYYIPAQCNNITFSMHHFHIYYTHDATVIPQCNSTIPWCSSTVVMQQYSLTMQQHSPTMQQRSPTMQRGSPMMQ